MKVYFCVYCIQEKALCYGLFSCFCNVPTVQEYYVSGVNPIVKNNKISTLFEPDVNPVYAKFKADCVLLRVLSLLHKLSQDSGIYIWLHNL